MRAGLLHLITFLLITASGLAVNPLYLVNDVGRASWSSRTAGFASKKLASGNSLYKAMMTARSNTLSRVVVPGARAGSRLVPRPLIPAILSLLDPLESAWGFYVNREEIAGELMRQGAAFVKKNSVGGLGVLALAYAGSDLLARAGVVGTAGEGLINTIRHSVSLHDAVEGEFLARTASRTVEFAGNMYARYRRLGTTSKFAVAFSAGAFFSQTMINATVAFVKVGLTTFVMLEGLSFLGVIGEPGESIVDWVDSNKDKTAAWMKQTKRFRLNARKHINFATLEDFYEAAVEEEQVASLGFAIGSLLALF